MRNILQKPLITEKSNELTETLNKYTFIVDPGANKIQIRQAVEDMYGVQVKKVNTLIRPRKVRTRYSKNGFNQGKTKLIKKAIITLAEGDEIDFYADI